MEQGRDMGSLFGLPSHHVCVDVLRVVCVCSRQQVMFNSVGVHVMHVLQLHV